MGCCGYKCSKYMLVAFNIMVMLIGIVIIAAAVVDINTIVLAHGGLKPISGVEIGAFMILVGLFIIIVAAFGCYSLLKKSSRMLNIFAYCLIVIIFMELLLGVACATLRPKMETSLTKKMRISVLRNKSGEEKDAIYKERWDYLQQTMKCCGSTGPENYMELFPAMQPPLSCCPSNKTDTRPTRAQRMDCIKQKKYYETGCEIQLLSNTHRTESFVIVGGIVFSFFEMIGFVLAPLVGYIIRMRGKKREDYPNSPQTPN